MTHHTRPYSRVTFDHPTGFDKRQLRRHRRFIGQHLAGLRAFANGTADVADKFRRVGQGAHLMATALGAVMPKAMARAAELDQAEARRKSLDA